MENTNLTSIKYPSRYCKQLESNLFDTVTRSDIRPYALELYSEDEEQSRPLKMTFRQSRPGSESLLLPITYQRRQIGTLSLSNNHKESSDHSQVNQLMQRIAYQVSRYQVGELSEFYLGRKMMLAGQSPAISNVELFIEKASCGHCPIMIVGESGTDKLAVAIALHFNGRHKHGAFVEIDCGSVINTEFKAHLEAKITGLDRGTLFLNGIDALTAEQQTILLETIALYSCGNEGNRKEVRRDFSLIAASTKNIADMTHDGDFSWRLYEELSFLEVSLPNLRQRAQDIPILIALACKRYRLFEEQSLSFEVIDALQSYHWPGNEMQLERAVARLLTLSDSNPVNLNDLHNHLPEMFKDTGNNGDTGKARRGRGRAENLTQHMLDKELGLYSGIHAGLFKALNYIAHNYEKEITLSELANNVFVSASHLSYLFKHHLKKSFKQVLSELRIERAKQKITEAPYARITDIFQEVGFGDLSHFEKIFKRHTGVTPREYKKKIQLMYNAS